MRFAAYLLPFCLAVAPLGAKAEKPKENCEKFLISQRTLAAWQMPPAEYERISGRNDLGGILQASAKLDRALKDAPISVLNLLNVLSHTRLGDSAIESVVQKHLAKHPGAANLEVILGQDLAELSPFAANLYFAPRFADETAKKWLSENASSPLAVMILSSVLSKVPPVVFQKSLLEVMQQEDASPRLQAHLGITISRKVRELGTADLMLESIVRSSAVLAHTYFMSEAILSMGTKAVRQALTDGKLNDYMSSPKVEELVEWSIAKSLRLPAAASVPLNWKNFYQKSAEKLRMPVTRMRKLGTAAYGLTEGDSIWSSLMAALYAEISTAYRIGEPPKDRAKLSADLKIILIKGISGKHFAARDSAIVARTMMEIIGAASLTSAEQRNLGIREIAGVVKELRRFTDDSTQIPSPDPVMTAAEAPKLPALFEPPDEVDISEALPASLAAAASVPGSGELEDLVNEKNVIENLRAEEVYKVQFLRPHAKFFGSQRVRFSRAAREAVAEAHAYGVHPLSWIHAIQMGIAREYGERGIKLLSLGKSKDLQFEVKLLMTPFRLTGHWRNGVWDIESIEDPHR